MRLTIPRVVGRAPRGRGGLATADTTYLDPLTGLPNARSLGLELGKQVELARENGQPLSLLDVHIDDLRTVNAAAGQEAGDAALRGVAHALVSVARLGDHVYRAGGDEFVVMMPGIDREDAVAAAERMLHFARRPASAPSLALSSGLSSVPAYAREAGQLRRQAEIARQWAARQGGAFVGIFDPERDDDGFVSSPSDAAALAEIIHARALVPAYQPIVDLGSGRVLGFEGLIRPDPSGPLSDAIRLFDAAVANDRTTELDILCVEAIVLGSSGMEADQVLTLNLSTRTLAAREFDAAWLLDRIGRAGIDTSRVIVELAGAEGIEDPQRLRAASDLLHRYGVRLAGDLGMSATSSELLSYLGVDLLKMDLGMLARARSGRDPLMPTRAIREKAEAREAIVVAERVETPAQLRVLHDLGITTAQGFLLGRPGRAARGGWIDLGSLAPSAHPAGWAATTWPRGGADDERVGTATSAPTTGIDVTARTETVVMSSAEAVVPATDPGPPTTNGSAEPITAAADGDVPPLGSAEPITAAADRDAPLPLEPAEPITAPADRDAPLPLEPAVAPIDGATSAVAAEAGSASEPEVAEHEPLDALASVAESDPDSAAAAILGGSWGVAR